MTDKEATLHVRGESLFIDDLPLPAHALFAAVVPSPAAHGKILECDTARAAAMPGVHAVLTGRDIPGENQIGSMIADEPLLATDLVRSQGEPIALVVADTVEAARRAARAVSLQIQPLPATFDPREAFRAGQLIAPQRTFECGDVDRAWEQCDVVVSGRVDSGAQEHLYLETQSAIAVPTESGLRIHSATQSPTGVQRAVARVLGLAMHRIEVNVVRLGGAFGGKEDQATVWAALAALGAWSVRRPVKLVLRRREDMSWTGKRHPYSSDFRIGLAKDGRIMAYEVMFHQNSGATADLSPAILERTLFHAANSYFIPNVRATGACCRTNLPSNTAFRGFGGPQAMLVIECAIRQAARVLGVEPAVIQERNLLRAGDALYYGMPFGNPNLTQSWKAAVERYRPAERRRAIAEFNGRHTLEKKGMAFMPVCFGISFTTTFLNQASAGAYLHRWQRVREHGGRGNGPGCQCQDPPGRGNRAGDFRGSRARGVNRHTPRRQYLPHRGQFRRRPQRRCGASGLPRTVWPAAQRSPANPDGAGGYTRWGVRGTGFSRWPRNGSGLESADQRLLPVAREPLGPGSLRNPASPF
jgi:xanthine dehydrogenase large subunit